MDGEKWSNELKEDLEVLNKLKEMATDFIKTDAKLNKLKQIITDKITHPNPKNGNNKKIIVFTAFSDTITLAAAPIIVKFPPKHAPSDKHHHSGNVYSAPTP